MMKLLFPIIYITLTICIYFFMKQVYNRLKYSLLVPVFTSSLLIVLVLLVFGTSYSDYMSGAKWIDELLGPAVVALAIPLYDHQKLVKKNSFIIILSVLTGSLIGIITGILLGLAFQVEKHLIYSLAPKSVTSPIAMEITKIVGGAPALAAVYVMVAGISGAMFGPYLMKLLRIRHSLSKGIGFGTAAHGIGTAKALEIGEVEGALSSIAMTLSAVFTSLLCPVIISILL